MEMENWNLFLDSGVALPSLCMLPNDTCSTLRHSAEMSATQCDNILESCTHLNQG